MNFNDETSSTENNMVEVNKIIPKFIGKSINFTKEMRNRIKCNLILSEFEKKAKDQFNFYLNESIRRYKTLKSGGSLNNQIKESQIKNKENARKILSDKFFTKLKIDNDKEAMKYNHNEELFEEMNDLAQLIINTNESSDPTNQIKQNINKKVFERRASLLFDKKILDFLKPKQRYHSPEKIIQAEEIMGYIIEKDTEAFKNEINIYKEKLDLMKEKILNGEEIKTKDFIFKPNLKMLNYEKHKPKKLEKKKQIPKVDMKKLLRFSQRFGKNIRKYEDEDKEKEKENKEESQNIITLPFITSPHYELKKYDYNNTIGMVKEIANNQVHIDEKFDVRKYLLEKMLKTDTLPSVDNYQVIIKERIDKIKNERRKKNIERAKIQSESLIDKADIALREIEENALKWEKRVEELDKEEEILNNRYNEMNKSNLQSPKN